MYIMASQSPHTTSLTYPSDSQQTALAPPFAFTAKNLRLLICRASPKLLKVNVRTAPPTSTDMADTLAKVAPGPNEWPDNPRPGQTRISISHDASDTNRMNNQQTLLLPQLRPSTPPFGSLALGAPPGFEHRRPHSPDSIGNQMTLAKTVSESQRLKAPYSTFSSRPLYPTEIFHKRVPPPGVIFGSSSTPDAVIFSNYPPPDVKSSSQASVAGASVFYQSSESLATSSLPMHKCFALASTRVVRLPF